VEDRTEEDGYIILHPKKEHEFTLIWLHGLGEQPEGFKDIFIDQRLCRVPDSCKVIIPLAPIR
jgi:phospholipase/carboxylesterase